MTDDKDYAPPPRKKCKHTKATDAIQQEHADKDSLKQGVPEDGKKKRKQHKKDPEVVPYSPRHFYHVLCEQCAAVKIVDLDCKVQMLHVKPKPNQPPVCMQCKKAKQACTWDEVRLKLGLQLQPTDKKISESCCTRKDAKSMQIIPTLPSSSTSKLPKPQSGTRDQKK